MNSRKTLVTVGTTPFDSLIQTLDMMTLGQPGTPFFFQIATGHYEPKHYDWVRFSDSIQKDYENAELVICHAGAGTVYQLLELGKRIIVVPNLERTDPHQQDLAAYIERQEFGVVCHRLQDISEALETAKKFQPKPYKKDPFKKGDYLNALFNDS